jgi:hypothetical protein
MAAGFVEMADPGVAMRVEVDHRQRTAQIFTVGAQQAERDRVMATQPAHVVRLQQPRHQRLHGRAHVHEAGVGQRQVAGITQHADGRHIEVRMQGTAQHVAGLADGARHEACAAAVGDGTVPGDAGHGEGRVGASGRHLQEGVL